MQKIRDLMAAQLRAGLSPERVALAVALGMVIGVFPVLGTTTMLCVIAAVVFRLNHAVIQAANYMVYPVFFVLVIPFARAGAWLFGTDAHALTLAAMRASYHRGYVVFARQLGVQLYHAAVAWLLVAPIAVALLWTVIRALVARRAR